jgi:hypothetical protein
MGEPINTPLTGDLWNLSIDDLLAPMPETQRLGGLGPFVINLSSSGSPIDVPAKGIAGCEYANCFLVQRIEDRRPRYRLRLGPFVTEDEADAALNKVRTLYPSALTATADAEDLRAMTAMRAKADAQQQPADRRRPPVTVTPPAALEIPSISLLATPPTPATSATPTPSATPAPSASPAPPARPVPSPAAVATPILAVPTVTMVVAVAKATTATPTPTAMRPPIAAAPVIKTAMTPAGATSSLPTVPAPPLVQQQVQQINKPLPNLDATLTVRALTELELEDEQASRWFVIQLALADDAFDPDVLPNLDIFGAYRLYSVAGIDQGRIVHALRMGFFSEEVGARAVASYLAAYYDNPTIKRVSSAERQRFADQRLEPRKDVGATGRQAVIEITNERFVRERKSTAAVSQKSR